MATYSNLTISNANVTIDGWSLYVNESDPNDVIVKDSSDNIIDQKRVMGYLLETIKDLSDKLEKLKRGYFYGTELLKNRLLSQ